MYKLIACDLDETLLNDEHQLSERNIDAIKKATKQGVKFVPATGRSFDSIQETLVKLGLADKENEYVLSYNGGAITENKGNRLLHFDGLSFEQAQNLYRQGMRYHVSIHVFTKDNIYTYHLSQNERDYLKDRIQVIEISDENLDFLKDVDIVKMIYVNTDYAYLKSIESELSEITKDIDISYSSHRYMEFNHKGVNKGSSLLKLAELLGIKQKETLAIGDNYNDLSMIRMAGLGVGVRNTVDEMKQYCDYITEATNNESAVAEVIEKFIL